MTHDDVIERLPWLVNGTLADGERREVEEHLAACPDCRAELSLTRETFELFSVHLPPRLLVAYAETPAGDRLTIDGETVDRRSVDAHLAHCDDCREELEMAREAHAALVGAPAGDVRPFVRPRSAAHPSPPRGAWLPVALAASLLLAVVSTGGWFVASREDGGEAQRAHIEALERELETARTAAPEDPDATAELRRLRRELGTTLERRGELEATVAALEERVARLAAGGSGEPPLDFLYAEGVLRNDGGAAATTLSAGGGGLHLVVLVPSLTEARTVAYHVTDGAGSTLLRGTESLEVRDNPVTGRWVSLMLPTAELPAERDLVLRLSDAGEEVARAEFRLAVTP